MNLTKRDRQIIVSGLLSAIDNEESYLSALSESVCVNRKWTSRIKPVHRTAANQSLAFIRRMRRVLDKLKSSA